MAQYPVNCRALELEVALPNREIRDSDHQPSQGHQEAKGHIPEMRFTLLDLS
jgi:hypothetical protein